MPPHWRRASAPGLAEQLAGAGRAFDLPWPGTDGAAVFGLDISAAADPASEGPLAGLGHFRDARVAAHCCR